VTPTYSKQAKKALEHLDVPTKQRIWKAINKLPVMIRFIPEDEALPDEVASHAVAAEEYRRGETFTDSEINWN
jgi:hypothetical protein